MAWYIHPSKQLRDDELPPELVVTNRDGSIEQAYVPYNAIERLKAENAKLRGIVCDLHKALFTLDIDHCQACPRDNINGPCTKFAVWGNDECSIEGDMRELGIEVE